MKLTKISFCIGITLMTSVVSGANVPTSFCSAPLAKPQPSLDDFTNFSARSLDSFDKHGFARKDAKWDVGSAHHTTRPNGPLILGVHFLDDKNNMSKQVLTWAGKWTGADGAYVKFIEEKDPVKSQIRVTFNDGGLNWSRLGKHATYFSEAEHTMALSDVGDPNFSRERWEHVAVHEFGHALGLGHEHRHPEGGITWNTDRVTHDHLGASWGECADRNWIKCKKSVVSNITGPLTASVYKSDALDKASIMVYEIPCHWTKDMCAPNQFYLLSGGYTEPSPDDLAFVSSKNLYARPNDQ